MEFSGWIILASVIILLAGFIHSTTGFGFALVATPLLLFVLEPKSVVIIVILLAGINSLILLFHYRHYVDIKRVLFLCIGSALGIPLGVYLLSSLNPSTIRLVIAILVIPFSISVLLGYSYRFKGNTIGCTVAGFIGGTLQASTSISGPPVVLFLLGQDMSKERFIGTLSAYFFFVNIVTVCTFSFMGMITADILEKVGILLPVLGLGFYIGTKALYKISTGFFKKIAMSVVFVSALVIILTSIINAIK